MIGGSIGHFRVVSRLGRGGMGEVYAGEHESIQTKVAIKVLHTDISENEDHVQRFFNEAKIVGKIKHAGIVKIFDVGHHDGHAYLIMELLEGEPLAARIQRTGRLSWQATAEFGRQTASVLDATHRAGIIHRDLKPDNIFLVPDHELAAGERVKVLDFGISKLSGTMAGASPKTIGTMGTPAYMAPEQWGESASVDWRADAYSLGCVLFEMASGRPPFIASTVAGACAQHLTSDPPALSELAAVPDALHALVMRLLAKEPAERGASMAEIARELAAIAGDATASVSSPVLSSGSVPAAAALARTTLGASAAQQHPTIAPRRNRRWLIGGGAAVLGVVGLFAVMAMRSPPATPETRVAVTKPDAPPEPPPDASIATPAPAPPPDLTDARRAIAERRWTDALLALDLAGATGDDAKLLRARATLEAEAEKLTATVRDAELRAAEAALANIPLTSVYRKSAEEAFAARRRGQGPTRKPPTKDPPSKGAGSGSGSGGGSGSGDMGGRQ